MSLVWSWAQVTVIWSVCVGFLQVLWFHPTFLKHAGQWIGYTKSSLGVIENLNVWCVCDGPFQGVFSHFVPSSSQDKGMNNQSKQTDSKGEATGWKYSVHLTHFTKQAPNQVRQNKGGSVACRQKGTESRKWVQGDLARRWTWKTRYPCNRIWVYSTGVDNGAITGCGWTKKQMVKKGKNHKAVRRLRGLTLRLH